ncbi:MAG: squalene synthase HpnC [Burkholderiaceae bacterium]
MQPASPSGVLSGVDHYENFPVASVLLPARIRPAVIAIYHFARYADDVADEGDAAPEQRIAELDRLRDALLAPASGDDPAQVAALRPHLAAHGLGVDECLALLSAFRQDVTQTRYADRRQLMDYCRRSADPVGRLLLALFRRRDARTEPLADAICSALQLVNFLQDTAIDWRRGRLYLPLDELAAAGLDPDAIAQACARGRAPDALRAFLAGQTRIAAALLESGAPLVARVPARLGWELRATLAGGRRIVESLSAGGHDPFAARPRLTWRDAPALARLMFKPPRLS